MPRKNINYIRRGFWKQHPGHWAENKGFTSLNPQQQAEAFKKWCLQHPNAQGIEPIKGVEYYDPVTGRSGKAGRQAFHDRQRAAQWARMQAAQSSNIRESTASGQASAQESSDQAASTSHPGSDQPIIKQEPISDTSDRSTTSPASAISAQPEAIATPTPEDRVDGRNGSASLPMSQAVVLFNPQHRVSNWLDRVSQPVVPAHSDASRKRSAAELDEEPSSESRKVRVTTLLDLPPSVPEAVEPTPLSVFDCGLLRDESELRLWSLGLQFRSWVTRVA